MRTFICVVLASVLLAGPARATDPAGPAAAKCRNCGTVRVIEAMDRGGAGAITGAVGGAAAGPSRRGDSYRVTVDMDLGGPRSIDVANPAGLQVGSRVRVTGRILEILED